MSTLNSSNAARLPFLKSLNTPQTSTAAGHSAANAQIANAARDDSRSEFSRLLVRSQTAAAVSQRAPLPAGKAPPPHRPVSPPPTSRADAAASSPADDPATDVDSTDAATALADDAGTAAAASRAQPSSRAAAAHSKSAAAAGDAESAATATADPAAVDALRPNDPVSATPPAAPTAAELASLAAWGALPMPPAAAPTASASEDAGEASADAELTADALPSGAATDLGLRPDRDAATHAPNGKAEPAVDAGLDAATANGSASDTALAHLELLSSGARPASEHALHHGTELATPPAWAIGASGASAQVRAVHPTAPPPAASIATPLTDGGFHEALGMQVSLLAREGIHQAELRLNPADMGPVSVQITMNGDQARVDFGADLAQTRQVIEAGWAELAASLQEAGFTLSGGGVSEHARNRPEPVVSSSRGTDRSGVTEEAPVVAVVAARPRAGAALDLYA